jgi:hypothetical protein|tara:strand:+ start:320 stop:595 length:276 start_codon:yes stop_codon:yes gene_type:complete
MTPEFYVRDQVNAVYESHRYTDPSGELTLSTARLNQIDLYFGFSVYSHLMPSDFVRELRFAGNSLAEDGVVVISMFLFDPQLRQRIGSKQN